jgi:hypothetical protein
MVEPLDKDGDPATPNDFGTVECLSVSNCFGQSGSPVSDVEMDRTWGILSYGSTFCANGVSFVGVTRIAAPGQTDAVDIDALLEALLGPPSV